MKKVLFVLLCVAAVVVVPACKKMSCKKEVPTVPVEQPVPAPVAPAPAVPAPAA